jgi:threonine dehydrogenase-like Zn-dependent dehydrogenase
MELINEQPLAAEKNIDQQEGRSAVLSAPKKFDFKPFDFRVPENHEILVKMEGCGICASNIPVWEGRPWFDYPLEPGAPGHEGWGVIEETGKEVKSFRKGQRVSLLSGNAFSTHVLCDADKAVELPEDLAGMPFPGEPVGCAMNIFSRSDIKPDHTVVILGVGFLGAVLIQLAKNVNARVIAVSRRESSLKLAKKMGADVCFNWEEKEQLHEYINKSSGCERVIECVGNQKALDLATEIISERGRLIVAGYHQEDLRHINMQVWNWKGIDVINAHERDENTYKSGIRMAIDAIQKGDVDISSLLTHEFAFHELNDAMETLTNYPDGFTKAYINYRK